MRGGNEARNSTGGSASGVEGRGKTHGILLMSKLE